MFLNYLKFNIALLLFPILCNGQNHIEVQFKNLIHNSEVENNTLITINDSTSINISALKYYTSSFKTISETQKIEEDYSYHLIDHANEDTKKFTIPKADLPNEKVKIKFTFGVDSLTNVSGALEGDLDPTKKMYWTWRSGYINFKFEGFLIINDKKERFTIHLGGYSGKEKSFFSIKSAAPLNELQKINIELDLYPLINEIIKGKKEIMSPSAKSVELSKIISQSFNIK